MAYEVPGFKLGTLKAGTDLSNKQFYPVKLNSGNAVLAGEGESIIGILQNKPIQGDEAEIMVDGVSKAVVGSTVVRDSKLAVNTNNKLVPASAGDYIVATALTSGEDNEIISVLLINEGKA